MVLFHIEHGSGTPLVLLHGFPFDHTIWDEVIGRLEKGIRIIAPDLRGHGRSMITKSEYSITDMAADIIDLMDQLQIREAVIAGHSMGGYIALEIVRNFPERATGLALISSHIFADPLEKKQSRLEDINRIMRQGVCAVLANMPDMLTQDDKVKSFCRDAVIRMDSIGAIGALHAMAYRTTSEDVWKALNIPTMVIAGSDDRLIPVERSRGFAGIPKHSTFKEINGTGHLPMLEAPDKVAMILVNFITDIRRNQ
jgi:pimeloyl-ACP methyl ester carboxylesterase